MIDVSRDILFYFSNDPARMVEVRADNAEHWHKYNLLWMSLIMDLLLCHTKKIVFDVTNK